jgi:hypothetical protein
MRFANQNWLTEVQKAAKSLKNINMVGPEGQRFLQKINMLAVGSPIHFLRMFSYGLANLLIKIRTDLRLKTRAVNKLAGDIFFATQQPGHGQTTSQMSHLGPRPDRQLFAAAALIAAVLQPTSIQAVGRLGCTAVNVGWSRAV